MATILPTWRLQNMGACAEQRPLFSLFLWVEAFSRVQAIFRGSGYEPMCCICHAERPPLKENVSVDTKNVC